MFDAHDAETVWPKWASDLSLESSSFLPMAERSAPAQASGEGGMRMTDGWRQVAVRGQCQNLLGDQVCRREQGEPRRGQEGEEGEWRGLPGQEKRGSALRPPQSSTA